MKLAKERHKIDSLDKKIVALLNKRANASLAIRKAKKALGRSVFTPSREKEVYKNVSGANKGPLSGDSLKSVYREIMSGSLALEEPLKIAYLGPEATFTHIAARRKFGESVDYVECRSIGDVFTEVERGRADYGVVPIENSTEGAVNHTLDMFIESELKICSEVYLRIKHNLLSKQRKIDSVKTIYSHQQVFAQCRIWIEKNLPNAKLASCESTSHGALLATAGKGKAAIASEMAAEKYGLSVLSHSIEDSSRNVTRFLIIGEKETEASRNDRTSILFSLKDKVGVLHDALVPFKKNRVNLTKIESRPSPMKAWEYYFFVDMKGHSSEASLKKAISDLEKNCTYLKILGSYPVGR